MITGFQIKRLTIRRCGLSRRLEERVGVEEEGGACEGYFSGALEEREMGPMLEDDPGNLLPKLHSSGS